MIMDKGLGLGQFQDMLELAADAIDFIKLGFGTAALTPPAILQKKIKLAQQHHVAIYFGGTFFEIHHHKEKTQTYFRHLQELGLQWVEISDGTIELSATDRVRSIQTAQHYQLSVITEIGKKTAGYIPSLSSILDQYHSDLAEGAHFILMEARETGENVGIFGNQGDVNLQLVKQIGQGTDQQHLMWEAPQKKQQVALMKEYGLDVNLGNISPQDILAVEALRRRLRSDTFL